jgi:hypothetical protein
LVETQWQQYRTHLVDTWWQQYSTHNTENRKYITIKGKKLGSAGCAPCLNYTLAFALQLRKKHGKPQLELSKSNPNILVTAVQYTFTHKQYTEQHNETEYTKNRTYPHTKVPIFFSEPHF